MTVDKHQRRRTARGKPLLEWGAALVGLILTFTLLGLIGWQAHQTLETKPPSITIKAERVVQVEGGYLVEITARNEGPTTGAAVQVEGTIEGTAAEPSKSMVTLDYIPGHSERRGGLFFTEDPRSGRLELRALGYAQP